MTHVAQFVVEALPYNAHLGLQVCPDGRIMLPGAEPLTNHLGTQHGGGLFSAGHAASCAAVFSEFRDLMRDGAVPAATRASIEYRGPARGSVFASAHVLAGAGTRQQFRVAGRAQCDVHVSLHDANDRDVATMTVTWTFLTRGD